MAQSKFKNVMGMRLSRGLFLETTEDPSSAIYTLKDYDHNGYPSLYRLYMLCSDPTEYEFATSHLDGWAHWETLTACSWFKEYAASWRKEFDTRLQAQALAKIMAEAEAGTPNAYHANKYLLDGSWKGKEATRRGRPTKDAIRKEAHRIASDTAAVAEDFTRVMRTN